MMEIKLQQLLRTRKVQLHCQWELYIQLQSLPQLSYGIQRQYRYDWGYFLHLESIIKVII